MNRNHSVIRLLLLLLAVFTTRCNTPETFELRGKLEGISEGRIIMTGTKDNYDKSDTAAIQNGEFIFTGDIPQPAQYILSIEGKEYPCYFYAENAEMTLTGHADSLYMAEIIGGALNEDKKIVEAKLDEFFNRWKLDSLSNVFQAAADDNTKRIFKEAADTAFKEYEAYQLNFVKENPASYYSAIIIEEMSYGQSGEEIEKSLAMLDPKLNDFTVVEDLRLLVENLKTTDVNTEEFTSSAPDIDYEVDNTFAGKELKDMVYLATFPDDNICGLRKDGYICMISPDGTLISEFKSTLTATPTAIAIDQSDNDIYVLGTKIIIKEKTVRGKDYKIEEAAGVECLVYNTGGAEINRIDLADLKSATGAKVISGKLLVADYTGQKVAIFDLKTKKMEVSINDLRTCCRILDFGVNDKNEILVANLGAFRVQAFDYQGAVKYAFGKRGQTVNDFHGCCNPVNVASLNSGAIVTVEKDPTRIKVYTRSGARQIAGIKELVIGCSYIPMTTDSNNNIYLASAQSGIVKCSPK
jgi:hypothetical protein